MFQTQLGQARNTLSKMYTPSDSLLSDFLLNEKIDHKKEREKQRRMETKWKKKHGNDQTPAFRWVHSSGIWELFCVFVWVTQGGEQRLQN